MQRTSLSDQVKKHAETCQAEEKEHAGGDSVMVSTGSTLLDLAISGGRKRGGGIPGGILVEIFGPPGAGKTVLLCEVAGAVQRQGGQVMFRDPEARLNKQFASMFGLDPEEIEYDTPSTVTEVFEPIRKWNPKPAGKIHGIFADSLAALSTEWEIEGKDNYGMRRAKEFSEQCRLTCRTLTGQGFLMVCSNQVRQNLDAGPYGQKYKSPGGESIAFYSSLRLRVSNPAKLKKKKSIAGKEQTRVVGVESQIEVFKSSVWEPYRTAPLIIAFNYGIDDIQANLRFLKANTKATTYMLGDENLGRSMEDAIAAVEDANAQERLREEVIDLWHEIEEQFKTERKGKVR